MRLPPAARKTLALAVTTSLHSASVNAGEITGSVDITRFPNPLLVCLRRNFSGGRRYRPAVAGRQSEKPESRDCRVIPTSFDVAVDAAGLTECKVALGELYGFFLQWTVSRVSMRHTSAAARA